MLRLYTKWLYFTAVVDCCFVNVSFIFVVARTNEVKQINMRDNTVTRHSASLLAVKRQLLLLL